MSVLKVRAGIYRQKRRDMRELIFFLFLGLAIFLKFYYLEYEVSSAVTRAPVSLAASMAAVVILLLPVSVFWRRGRLAAALLLDLLLTALALTDALHMRYYSDLFTLRNLGLSTQVGEISESVFALFTPYDLLYFVDFPLLFIYWRVFRKFSVRPFFRSVTLKRVSSSLLLCFAAISLFLFHLWSYSNRLPGVLRSMWDRPAVCNNIGAFSYHAVDIWNTAADTIFKPRLSEADIESLKERYMMASGEPRLENGIFGVARGKNLIVIQVESLQSFAVGLKLNGKEVTPNINAFIKQATYHTDIFNQTAAGNSSDAEFIANTAFYPAATGVAYTRFAGNTFRAFPSALKEAGYSTFGMHGDRAGFWNRAHMYPALGFDRFVSRSEYVNDEALGMGLSDKTFFRQSAAMLKKEPRPFYAFMITLTSHYPFNFPELLQQVAFDSGPYKGTVVGNYLAAINYFDTQFGMFLKQLKKAKLYDSSVIVVYGDHNAIPKWDSPTLSKLLGVDLSIERNWRNVSKVPLIINVPGLTTLPADAKMAKGLANLPSSLGTLLGVKFNAGLGQNIFAAGCSDAPMILRNGSYVTGDAYVETALKRATNLKTGAALDYGEFREMTENVEKMLEVSDRILEYDLLAQFSERGTEER